jgi:hypothetical protein
MALETGTLPADLVTTNPTSGDPKAQGDDHLRLIKTAVKNAAAGPAFGAYQGVLQSIATATLTKLQFQTEEFDTATAFDSSVNFRFTPLVAGYYQFDFSVGFASTVPSLTVTLYKNGSRFKDGAVIASGIVVSGSALVHMNGTTDYVEVFAQHSNGSNVNTSAAQNQTYFAGFLARLA